MPHTADATAEMRDAGSVHGFVIRVSHVLAADDEHDHFGDVGRMVGDALEVLPDRLQTLLERLLARRPS
jgi:hypothetical protein